MGSSQLSAIELTRISKDWSSGDASALERLTTFVCAELRHLAYRNMAGERDGQLLQPSALVYEAFLRLIADELVEGASRTQFFAFARRLMRQTLIDFARAQDTGKRGRRNPHIDLSGTHEVAAPQSKAIDFADPDAALDGLAQLDARQARVVELLYFGSLENDDIAVVPDVSKASVARYWRAAWPWPFGRLQSGADS